MSATRNHKGGGVAVAALCLAITFPVVVCRGLDEINAYQFAQHAPPMRDGRLRWQYVDTLTCKARQRDKTPIIISPRWRHILNNIPMTLEQAEKEARIKRAVSRNQQANREAGSMADADWRPKPPAPLDVVPVKPATPMPVSPFVSLEARVISVKERTTLSGKGGNVTIALSSPKVAGELTLNFLNCPTLEGLPKEAFTILIKVPYKKTTTPPHDEQP